MAFCYVTGDSAASEDRGGFPFDASSLTSSSALLTLWSPPHLAHLAIIISFGLRHLFWHLHPLHRTLLLLTCWLCSWLWRSYRSMRVRWEQVVRQDADWPDCVTLGLAHIEFFFGRLNLSYFSSWYKGRHEEKSHVCCPSRLHDRLLH